MSEIKVRTDSIIRAWTKMPWRCVVNSVTYSKLKVITLKRL